MKRVWVPDSFYRFFPVFCIAMGMVVIPTVSGVISILLGTYLLLYGLGVYATRLVWRETC